MCPGWVATGPGILREEQCPGDGDGSSLLTQECGCGSAMRKGQQMGTLFLKGCVVLSTAFPFPQRDLQPFQTCPRDLKRSLHRQPFPAFYLSRIQTFTENMVFNTSEVLISPCLGFLPVQIKPPPIYFKHNLLGAQNLSSLSAYST